MSGAARRFVGGGYSMPPWIIPPVNSQRFDVSNYVAFPAIAGKATVVKYLIPAGRNGVLWKIANNFVGGGWTEGGGAITWQIFIDAQQTQALQGYQNILTSLGNPSNPVEIPFGRLLENQTLSLVVSNASIIVAGQLSGGRLMGWHYPKQYDDPYIGIQ